MIAVMVLWDIMIIPIIGLNVLFECLNSIMYLENGINVWIPPQVSKSYEKRSFDWFLVILTTYRDASIQNKTPIKKNS